MVQSAKWLSTVLKTEFRLVTELSMSASTLPIDRVRSWSHQLVPLLWMCVFSFPSCVSTLNHTEHFYCRREQTHTDSRNETLALSLRYRVLYLILCLWALVSNFVSSVKIPNCTRIASLVHGDSAVRKSQVTLLNYVRHHEDVSESGGTDPSILDLRTRWLWSASRPGHFNSSPH